jgi:ribosomal protein S18 acetylase RimI-like enzyme
VDDSALLRSVLTGTREFSRAVATEVHELDGVLAAVVPACPERSVFNCVSYERREALERALGDLARIYDEARVMAWTVWVPDGDRDAAAALEAAGHVLDAGPEAMGMDLDRATRPGPPADWTREGEPAVVAAINDRAYGYEDSFARALVDVDERALRFYVARREGLPSSCCITVDRHEDCHMTLVATLPEARGRGLAGALMANALVDARERGLRTSTLVATKMGRPIYERLGYRGLGPVEMWERRVVR